MSDTPTTSDADDDANVHSALTNRIAALNNVIGKRYVCRTQLGFLNLHEEPGDPCDTSNIVNQLREGQIVTSTGSMAPGSTWIPHDAGGWSISSHGGFVWLEEWNE